MLLDFTAPFNLLRAVLRRRSGCPPIPLDILCPLTHPDALLPTWVTDDLVVQKYRALLGDLPWAQFPERTITRPWPGPQPQPRAPFVAAYLIKLHEGKRFMSDLRTYLIEHPALVYWLGFARLPDPTAPHGFNVPASVPTRRHFSSVLRTLPNLALQFLLDATVHALQATLPPAEQASFGDVIAGDTQALLAWVKENNPKQYIKEGRLDKTRQPKGDGDCKLGVKHRRNHAPADADGSDHPTPTSDAAPASKLKVGVEIFWGYASGVVATRLSDGAEVVLAERTRPFNESDPSYFHPLMAMVEARLGRRPRYGTWDAAYDAHYVHEYFHQAGGCGFVSWRVSLHAASGRVAVASFGDIAAASVFARSWSRLLGRSVAVRPGPVIGGRARGIRPILGAEVTLEDGHHLTLLVENEAGWRNLCTLISCARMRMPKGQAALPWADLEQHTAGLVCLSGCRQGPIASALLRWDRAGAFRMAKRLRALFGPERCWIELQHHLRDGKDSRQTGHIEHSR
jgi:hypothetical protein